MLERLESRQLLYATSGGAWANRNVVTYSFMPDGTSVGGVPSALFQTLNRYYPTATWQSAFQKAAAIWQAVADVNFVLVPDDGSAVGSGTLQQGAANVGDIRVGATPQAGGQLGFAFLPPAFNGGGDAGDVFINSNACWGFGGYDLQTVALHELGHALGMSHSAIATAEMYGLYNGIKQSLTSDDVNGLQTVYGPQPADSVPNGSPSSAAPVVLNSSAQAIIAGATIDSATDQDWFSVVVPANTSGTMTVSMQTKNISSLNPRVTVYNGLVQGLAQASVTYGFGGTATVTINGVSPGQKYYVRASSAVSGAGAVGDYALLVNLGGGSMSPLPLSLQPIIAQPDLTGGSAYLDTVTGVVVTPPGLQIATQRRKGDPDHTVQLPSQAQVPDDDGHGNGKVGVGTLIGWGDTFNVGDVPRGPRAAIRQGGRRGMARDGEGSALWSLPETPERHVTVTLHGRRRGPFRRGGLRPSQS